MNKIYLIIFFLYLSFPVNAQNPQDEQQREEAFFDATKKWFTAWELLCRDIYKMDKFSPVDFVFFDDKYVYSTSGYTIKNGSIVTGNSLSWTLTWKKALHHDTLILPDKSVVPVQLMSFAAPIPGKTNKSFFVMPLPSFWKQSGVNSKEIGLEKMLTGVFIHEFSHSQQMQNFGKQISIFEQQNDFGTDFNDDIVQNIFRADTPYLKLYNKEVDYFYKAIDGKKLNRRLLKRGLKIMKQRQDIFFTGIYSNLGNIDDFFLTMEGLGQYSMYLWLTHPRGGNINKEVAIAAVRRNKKSWSQDEGLGLFLILERLAKPEKWAKEMFGYKTESVISLIRKELR